MSHPLSLLAALTCSTLAIAAAPPRIFPGGVVNGASFAPAPAPVAPGSIASIFGSDLASSTSSAASSALPATLGGVQVLVNGVAAPLFFVSPGQINLQIPWEIGAARQLTVTVSVDGVSSNTVTVDAANPAPGCFRANQTDQGAILIAGSDALAAPAGSAPGRVSRPAGPGDYLSLYCTGLGSVTNQPPTGGPGTDSPLSHTLVVPSVTIGSVPARVTFSGLAPSLTACNQINVQVPDQAPSGDAVPVVVTAGDVQSNTVTAAIAGTAGPEPGFLAITSLSTTSPLPMTPLTIRTAGLNTGVPAQVRFSNASGFTATMRALRVAADGTVIAPVPLYVDRSTGQIAAGTVSFTVVQGQRSTAPVTVAIRNLPALSEYGTRLGKISDAVLVFDSIMIGQRLNQFQAYQTLPDSVNASQARSTLGALLTAINRARIDVSRVVANNSQAIPGGTLADGTALQFDRESLELMDRVNGLFLSQTFATLPASSIAPARGAAMVQRLSVADVVDLMEKTATANQISQAAMEALNPQNTWAEMVEASASALGVYFEMLPAARSKLLGPAAAVISDLSAIGNAFGNFAALIQGLATNNGELTKVAYDALNESTVDTVSAGIDMVLLLTGNVAQLGTASTVASFLKSFYDLGVTSQTTLEGISKAMADDLRTRPPASTLGVANGSTPLPSESQITSPQAGIEICCFTTSASTLTSVTDPSGSYTLWVPLQAAATDYQRLVLRAVSLLTGIASATGTADLRGLRATIPVTLPALTSGTPGMAIYEGTYDLVVTSSATCLTNPPQLVPAELKSLGAKILLVSSGALESATPGGSPLSGYLIPQGTPSMTVSCSTSFVGVDPFPFACAANGSFTGTSTGSSVSLTLQTAAMGCPDHIIPGTVSNTGAKPTVSLAASYTQMDMFGHPASVAFSATLTKK